MQSTQLLETILSRDVSSKKRITAIQIETIARYATPKEIEELVASGSVSIYQAYRLYCWGAHVTLDMILDCKKPCEPEELKEMSAVVHWALHASPDHHKCWNLVDLITNLSSSDGARIARELLKRITKYVETFRKSVVDAALDVIFDQDFGQVQVAHPILYMQPGTRRPLLELCDREQTYKFLRNISIVGCFDAEDVKVAAKKLEITPV